MVLGQGVSVLRVNLPIPNRGGGEALLGESRSYMANRPNPPPPHNWAGGGCVQVITRALTCWCAVRRSGKAMRVISQGWNQQDCSGVVVGLPLRLDP